MEIIFTTPLVLLLLFVIPLLIILHYYFFHHNKKKAMKFANFSALKRVTGTHLITKNTGQLVFRIVVIFLLILSSAQPVIWYESKINDVDYVIAIDVSASMISQDVLPSRLELAKQSAISFLDRLESKTKIGVIAFSGVSFVKSNLNSDIDQVKKAISEMDVELSGGTDIGGAMITAVNLLSATDNSKAIILITDGSDTSGTFIDDSIETALEYIVKSNTMVHTIAIGSGQTKTGYLGDSNLPAIYNKETLSKISTMTYGNYYEVKSTAEIATAFKDIKSEDQTGSVSYDASILLFLLGFSLLIVEWILLNTRFRALP